MHPSAELKSIILQLYGKEASGELFGYAKQLYSQQDGVLIIGSDPNEFFEDYNSITRFYEAEGVAGFEIKVDDIKAYCEDTVGWVIDRLTVKLPNGIEVPVRHTYIFHGENDTWKIAHAHISVGVPNESL